MELRLFAAHSAAQHERRATILERDSIVLAEGTAQLLADNPGCVLRNPAAESRELADLDAELAAPPAFHETKPTHAGHCEKQKHHACNYKRPFLGQQLPRGDCTIRDKS